MATKEVMVSGALVAEVAQRYAKRHNWCGVVSEALKEMGLGMFLPDTFFVQRKEHSRARWTHWDGQVNERSVLAAARRSRREAVDAARHRHENAPIERSVSVLVRPDTDTEDLVKQVEKVKQGLRSEAFVVPRYPAYRAVRRTGMDEDTVLWSSLDEEAGT